MSSVGDAGNPIDIHEEQVQVTLVTSHAALTPEAYWKSVLSNTPMPKTIMDLLYSGKAKEGGHSNIKTSEKIRSFYAASTDTKDQLYDNTNTYFLPNALSPGTTLTLHFTKTANSAPFLPRPLAQSIPFSSSKIPQILHHFSLTPNSKEAEIISKIIKQCEKPGIKGEDKFCATSLESMIDFSISKLGNTNDVNVESTVVEKQTVKQKYSIVGTKKMVGKEAVVCHKQNYEYAVFYCHKTVSLMNTYMVSLVGGDGTRVRAGVMCHIDTSEWDPKNEAFQLLKVQPGTVPICHFLNEDDVIWVAK